MKLIPTIFILALLLGSSVRLNAQEHQNVQNHKELFRFDALNFYSTEGTRSRIDIYIEIPLENFEFKKSKDDKNKFTAAFDLTIDAEDQSGKRVYDNVSKEELTTTETSSEYLQQNSQIIAKNLFLNPGKYKLKINIYESATQRHSEIAKDIDVADYLSGAFSLSNIMFVSRLSEANGKKFITPSVSKQVGSLDTFDLFFYVYKNNTESPIDVFCKIYDENKKEIFSWANSVGVFANMQNQFIVPVATSGLNYGKYDVEITASNPQFSTTVKSQFDLASSDFPFAMNDIDKLIDQLQYIAKEKEMDFMRDGKTKEEKEKRFLDFWKSKDPTPLSKRNEVMNEYYKRLFYANKHFATTYTEGWRSDMGMVFVIFGAPGNIDRHPYDMDTKPYEIWDYYDINKQFVFVDNTGFGDYRLITPIWDTFRYERN